MIFRKLYTDEQLIQMLKSGGRERDTALHYLFVDAGWRQAALRLIYSLGGTLHEAEDAVQEAFIVFDHHVRTGRYQQMGGLKNYFLGICRGRWYSHRRSTRRLIFDDNLPSLRHPSPYEGVEEEIIESERREHLKNLLNQLDERCRELLALYRLNYSMEEIAKVFNLGNENNARQRVHQCRQKLAKLIQKHPFFNEQKS